MKLDILTLREIWRARSGREKTLLYGLLWRPAATHRARLSAEIWALQSELAQIKQQEQEARRLARASSSATLSGEALTAALQASLAASGLDKAKILSVRDGARIQLSAAPFSNWVAWLERIRKQYKARVAQTQIKALAQPGRVEVDAVLQPSQ